MEIRSLKISAALKAEIYQSLATELKERGFRVESQLFMKSKKNKRVRIAKNYQQLPLEQLYSREDEIYYSKITADTILPDEFEYKIVFDETTAIQNLEEFRFPKILFVVGVNRVTLSSAISSYQTPLFSCIWLNPKVRPVLLKALCEIEAKRIACSFKLDLEKKMKRQGKSLKGLEEKIGTFNTFQSQVELKFEQVHLDMKHTNMRLDKLDNRMDKLDNRMDKLDESLGEVMATLSEILNRLHS